MEPGQPFRLSMRSAMSETTINLADLHFLVADESYYYTKVIQSIFHGFGVRRVLATHDAVSTLEVLIQSKIDLLICDTSLPPAGGLSIVRGIRRNPSCPFRTLPIMVMTTAATPVVVAKARDAGANMVIAKPVSPKALYQRLAWIAFSPRPFVDAGTYFGPDRRFKIEGFPNGVGRRAGDKPIEVGMETGPAMSQDEIDNLLSSTRSGQA
ncbi:MAG TPA: response regulator [Xanthobacteraceae bacterium]